MLRGTVAMVALGTPGIVSLAPVVADQLGGAGDVSPVPVPVLVALALLQSFVLLLVASAVGVTLAPRVGLHSRVLARVRDGAAVAPGLVTDLRTAVPLGVGLAVATLGLDAALAPFLPEALQTSLDPRGATVGSVLAFAPVRFLYGGVTEELLVRFGVMTLAVWLGWRLLGRSTPGPTDRVVWGGVVVAALVFGVGHLPSVASVAPLTPPVVVRTVLLNGLPGLGFGWLYWRRSLESAMVAHASFHVVLVVVSLAVVLLG